MERESFESPEVAQILNSSFIPIKIDREERPDIDAIYMNYVQVGVPVSSCRPHLISWLARHAPTVGTV